MSEPILPPVVSVVGRKNSGKTTLVVALVARLSQHGLRIATVKHGHHAFEIDEPGRDSWRHFNEGGAEAVLVVGAGKIAMVARTEAEPDPRLLIERHFAGGGFDLVLVEGYKHGPFRKIEVHRSAIHPSPIHDPTVSRDLIAFVTDQPPAGALCPVIEMGDDERHVSRLVEILMSLLGRSDPHE